MEIAYKKNYDGYQLFNCADADNINNWIDSSVVPNAKAFPIYVGAGSKVTHNGVKYISQVDNNFWEPGAPGVYENIWKVEEAE